MSGLVYGDHHGGGYYNGGYFNFQFMLLEQLARQFFLSVLPTGVKLVVKVIFGVFILQLVFPSLSYKFAFCPAAVLQKGQFWLLWTGPLLHADVQHVCLNMLAVCSFHSPLERKFGTLRYLELVLWSMFLTKLCYLGLALFQAWYYSHGNNSAAAILHQGVVGFSGVIFLLSVLECHLFPQFVREIHVPFFGNFYIKSHWYPWVLLFLCEFIMPHSSFTGHLAGILAGVGVQTGWIRPWYVPAKVLQNMENWSTLRFLTSDRFFTETPSFGSEPFGNSSRSRRASLWSWQRNNDDDSNEEDARPTTSASNDDGNEDIAQEESSETATTRPEFDTPSAEDMRELRRRRYEKSDLVKKPKKKQSSVPLQRPQYFTSQGRTLNSGKKERVDDNGTEATDPKEDQKEEPVKPLSPEELRALRRKHYQGNNKKKATPKAINDNPDDRSRDDYRSASYRARVSAQWAEANATDRHGFNPFQATNNGYNPSND